MYWFGTKDIKYYLAQWISAHSKTFKNQSVLDIPAGNGITSRQLAEVGAQVTAMDLFPDFFRYEKINCIQADLSKDLPLEKEQLDAVICQEGIEHVTDQLKVFKEFNRVLKTGGRLVITTPNASNLRSKLSHLLCESELYGKIMPLNEVESIWHSKNSKEIYFGHINLIGATKLRFFGEIAGFKLTKIHPTRVNYTALFLFILFYPFIFLFSIATYRRFLRKNKNVKMKQVLNLMLSPSVLLCGHLIAEFEKVKSIEQISSKSLSDSSSFIT